MIKSDEFSYVHISSCTSCPYSLQIGRASSVFSPTSNRIGLGFAGVGRRQSWQIWRALAARQRTIAGTSGMKRHNRTVLTGTRKKSVAAEWRCTQYSSIYTLLAIWFEYIGCTFAHRFASSFQKFITCDSRLWRWYNFLQVFFKCFQQQLEHQR